MTHRNALLTAGIKFTGHQHPLQLFEHQWKCLVKAQGVVGAEFPAEACAVGQKVQAVAFLHQACAEARGDIVPQPPRVTCRAAAGCGAWGSDKVMSVFLER